MSETIDPRPDPPAPDAASPGFVPRNPTVAYERTDVNTRSIIWFVTALAVGIVVVMAGLVVFQMWIMERESQEKGTQYPVAADVRRTYAETDPERLLPPSPRLEGIAPTSPDREPGRVRLANEPQEHEVGRSRPGTAAALNEAQERALDEWRWADPDHTAAHIPIGEAMSRLATKPREILKARGDGGWKTDETAPPSRNSSGRWPNEGSK